MENKIEISKELELHIDIKEGKVILSAKYEGNMGGAALEAFISTDKLIDLICAKIPGQLDEGIGEILKIALRKV